MLEKLGINLKAPTLTIIDGFLPFIFVIPPVDFSVTQGTNHESVQIIDVGEHTITGKRQLQRISWSGFFPDISSHFYTLLAPMPPVGCVSYLEDLANEGKVIKLIIPQWAHFFRCKVENFTITHQDHTGDIYYNISLIEDREDISTTLDLVTGLISNITK